MKKIVWKDVPGYNGRYKVSNTGQVKEVEYYKKHPKFSYNVPEHMLVPFINSGYLCVYLKRPSRYAKVHRLVAEAFIPNPDNCSCVRHKDRDKSNNTVQNLEWCSRKMISTQANVQPPKYYGKCVKCVETGQTFHSMKAAAAATGLCATSISNSIYLNRTIKGYTFILI